MKKPHILIKTTLLALLLGGTITPPAQASIYSLASKTMELVDPDGKNMVKFLLTATTATVIYCQFETIERRIIALNRRYNLKNGMKACSAAIIAWAFWSAVLPNDKK